MVDIEHDHYKTGDADGQARDIQDGDKKMLPYMPKGDFKIMLYHGDEFLVCLARAVPSGIFCCISVIYKIQVPSHFLKYRSFLKHHDVRFYCSLHERALLYTFVIRTST
jgi:hypothetical protein